MVGSSEQLQAFLHGDEYWHQRQWPKPILCAKVETETKQYACE
jgi:hypothetical protein